ncbi:hypothetical protein VTH06DRAFT_2630 [Thermothelomyces fergusii]
MQHRITPAAMPGLTIATDVQPPATANRRASVSFPRSPPLRQQQQQRQQQHQQQQQQQTAQCQTLPGTGPS